MNDKINKYGKRLPKRKRSGGMWIAEVVRSIAKTNINWKWWKICMSVCLKINNYNSC